MQLTPSGCRFIVHGTPEGPTCRAINLIWEIQDKMGQDIPEGAYRCRCGQSMVHRAALDTTDLYRCPDVAKCQRVVFILREGLDAGNETWYRQERLRGNRTAYPWWLRKAEAIRRRETI